MRASAFKAIAASVLAVMAATSLASAADLAPRYTKAPPPIVEVWNWTGFYIGGNWTAKLEYLYVDLGTTSGSFVTTIPALGGGVLTHNYSSRITDNIVRVGLNYKFGGPVVAKY